MKYLYNLLAALLILSTLAMPAHAEEGPLTISDAQALVGQTIHLTVSLSEPVTGNTMGISYDYDPAVMKVIPGECRWSASGSIQDFSSSGHDGVWAAGSVTQLRGEICLLTFRLLPGQVFENSPVTCELITKNGAKETGRYQAVANVTASCAHVYSEWKGEGAALHSRSCPLCGSSQSQSHSWGDATESQDPDNADITLKTIRCSVCGETQTERIQKPIQEIKPDIPVVTVPPETQPETLPTIPLPTQPLPTAPPEPPAPTRPTIPTEPSLPTESLQPLPTAPTQPTKPATPSLPTESVQPTQPSAPVQNQQSQNTQTPQATQPASYQPKDYNAPPQEESEQTETYADADGTSRTVVIKEHTQNQPKANLIAPKPTQPKVTPTTPPAEPSQTAPVPSSQEMPQEQSDVLPVLLIAAASAIMLSLVPLWEKKRKK